MMQSEEYGGPLDRQTKKKQRKNRLRAEKERCRHTEGYDIGDNKGQCDSCGKVMRHGLIGKILPAVNSPEWVRQQKEKAARKAV